jgi:hypothetical protein
LSLERLILIFFFDYFCCLLSMETHLLLDDRIFLCFLFVLNDPFLFFRNVVISLFGLNFGQVRH